MKTTVDIADPLFKQAKQVAARRGITLKALLEAALRDALAKEGKKTGKFRLKTHKFKGRGLQPGLSWDDWDKIMALCYEGRGG